jgi:PAS domain S-box-containing protein
MHSNDASLEAIRSCAEQDPVARDEHARTEEITRSGEHRTSSEDPRFFESLLENVPEMIFVKDARELRFVRVNRAAERLVGFRRDELLGRNDHDFFPKEEADFFTQKDRDVLRSGELVEIPCEPIHTAQGLRFLRTKKIPICNAQGEAEYLLGISADITAQKNAEDALLRKTEALLRSNRELEEFAYFVSHDLQEPLRKILAFGDSLEESAGARLDPDERKQLAHMLHAARRMRLLIRDLLELSRITHVPEPLVTTDLNAIFREVLNDLSVPIRDAGAEVATDPLPRIQAAPEQMHQLLANLLGNSLKFRSEQRTPAIRVSANTRGEFVEIGIHDNGIGFEEAHAQQVFLPFRRLHAASRYPGTGIGLAICQRIVERHGGQIRAYGTPGVGSSFLVSLPSAPAGR